MIKIEIMKEFVPKIRKDNALIEASYKLELCEHRLILLSIVEARKNRKGVTSNELLEVYAYDYAKYFNVHRNTAYQALKDACKNLFERKFSTYCINKNGKMEYIFSRWVSEVRYVPEEGCVKLIFAPTVISLITELENKYTEYELQQIASLNSSYANRLYEILIQWRSTGKLLMISVDELKRRLGIISNEYQTMEAFKRRVLNLSITQINEYTDIKVSYEQHKQGRTIVGFTFTFKQKKKQVLHIEGEQNIDSKVKKYSWQTKGLSDAQIAKIGCNLKEFINTNRNKILSNDHRDYSTIFSSWKVLLKDPKNVNSFQKIQDFLEMQSS
jgi:plasmid replication initiation protein